MIFQLKYKGKTDRALLFEYVRRVRDEPEFFLRKAIRWALREYARTEPEAVRAFCDRTDLALLSRREAPRNLT